MLNCHLVPGPVSSLTLTVLNVSSITVLWSGVPVALANGIVQGYRVVLQEYQGEDIAERIINSSELVTTFLNLLSKLQLTGCIYLSFHEQNTL